MNTSYKTRASWMLESLEYFGPLAYVQECQADYANNEGGHPAVWTAQHSLWAKEGAKSAANATAVAGSPCLVRQYVDAQGYLLP